MCAFKHFKFTVVFLILFFLLFVLVMSWSSSRAGIVPLELDAEGKMDFFSDDSGGVIVFKSVGDNLSVVSSKKDRKVIKCDCKYDFVIKQGKNIYLFDNNADSKETSICCYSITKNQFSDKHVYKLDVSSESNVAILKGGKFFYLSNFSGRNVFSFMFGKQKISGHALKETIAEIKNSPSGDEICTRDKNTGQLRIYDKTFNKEKSIVLSIIPEGDFEFLSSDMIFDSNKNLFVRDMSSECDFKKVMSVDVEDGYVCKSLLEDYLAFGLNDKEIKLFSISECEEPIEYKTEGYVKFLTSYKDKLISVEEMNGKLFVVERSISEIKDSVKKDLEKDDSNIIEENVETVLTADEETQSVESQEQFSTKKEKSVENLLRSLECDVDFSNHVIRNVRPDTTVSKIKKIFSSDDSKIKFLKKGKEMTSGKIGTGTKLFITDNQNNKNEFDFVIKGDVTGSGTVNRLDVRAVYQHIFCNKALDGLNFEAADINGDGKVDTLDLLAISKITG